MAGGLWKLCIAVRFGCERSRWRKVVGTLPRSTLKLSVFYLKAPTCRYRHDCRQELDTSCSAHCSRLSSILGARTLGSLVALRSTGQLSNAVQDSIYMSTTPQIPALVKPPAMACRVMGLPRGECYYYTVTASAACRLVARRDVPAYPSGVFRVRYIALQGTLRSWQITLESLKLKSEGTDCTPALTGLRICRVRDLELEQAVIQAILLLPLLSRLLLCTPPPLCTL